MVAFLQRQPVLSRTIGRLEVAPFHTGFSRRNACARKAVVFRPVLMGNRLGGGRRLDGGVINIRTKPIDPQEVFHFACPFDIVSGFVFVEKVAGVLVEACYFD